MRKVIWFDMDGTIADLYGVDNWLDKLQAADESPYMNAPVMMNMNTLARYLNRARELGYKIGIISWLSKVSSTEYDMKVTAAKKKWLSNHLRSVVWDFIHIVPYGTPKSTFIVTKEDILFDDEKPNRDNWNGVAYQPSQIMSVLQAL